MIAKAKTTDAAAVSPVDHIADAQAKLAEVEAKVADLTRRVFVESLAEQRELQARIEEAERSNNNAAWVEARSALNDAKHRRNATIDELQNAKGDVVIAKAEVDRLHRARRRQETIARAESLATSADLLEEQRQIPALLVRATRDLDIEEVRALRRRLAELPELIYVARVLEAGRASEELQAAAATATLAAEALAPDLEVAEERVRLATQARDKIATEIGWLRTEARDAQLNARAREREMDNLIAQAARAAAVPEVQIA